MPAVSLESTLSSSADTEALGRALARALPGGGVGAADGAVLYLHGELGAGKTTCARSLLQTLGVTGPVRSPTYTLVETYNLAGITCTHVDLYRLQTLSEVDELGLRDLLGPQSLLLVEWPDRGGAALPPADVEFTLRYAAEGRQAALVAKSSFWAEWLRNLGRDTSLRFYVSNLT